MEHKIIVENFKSVITSLVNPRFLKVPTPMSYQLTSVQLNNVYVLDYVIASIFRGL